jgi:uncharacterized cupredoxin-like copper-binding protein
MKSISSILVICALTIPALAQTASTNSASAQAVVTNMTAAPVAVIPASAGTVTAPLVLTNGIISQPEQTELDAGGKAIFTFTITNEGDYIFTAMINAADESANSFFVNVDANPEDPMMIWDMDVTTGFEERTVGWRGNGDANADEISPKKFHLTAGAHKLIIVGREPTQLKSVSIKPAAN